MASGPGAIISIAAGIASLNNLAGTHDNIGLLIGELGNAAKDPKNKTKLEQDVANVNDISGDLKDLIKGTKSMISFVKVFSDLDAAISGQNQSQVGKLLREKAKQFYLSDQGCPLAYEPSGQDFVSPCLAEADFVRRVLEPREFARWLTAFLPQIPGDGSTAWLPVARVTDRSDPKLAHLDGLNLSRAWMLEGIADGLPADDKRRNALRATARLHTDASLGAVTSEHYVGSHWLGTFALYGASR
jgi:hypothetical protein